VATSPSSEPPAWFRDVYDRRRRRTVRLVELSIAPLERVGERLSLAAIACISKTVDPAEPDGVSESAILHNEEGVRALSSGRRSHATDCAAAITNRIRVSADRDRGRTRQRLRARE
jgi:hypothetical protein